MSHAAHFSRLTVWIIVPLGHIFLTLCVLLTNMGLKTPCMITVRCIDNVCIEMECQPIAGVKHGKLLLL